TLAMTTRAPMIGYMPAVRKGGGTATGNGARRSGLSRMRRAVHGAHEESACPADIGDRIAVCTGDGPTGPPRPRRTPSRAWRGSHHRWPRPGAMVMQRPVPAGDPR